ncbi:PEP-CTERM sorting domain-containing protein [Roseibacillus persicicus]|uniref:PEP-CTERM protein-sorting domain-containing protein n=1 Tax=Roseibacillus persicicus TaxID=454148 RepID=A0A918WGA6_9BACT|nr:PEP-CTERM sorting domain-containing protein [Roseibacillus persicicus]GHC42177.1 hypothetical protein GCM10007100_03900 [Roseibacillus persicicus]
MKTRYIALLFVAPILTKATRAQQLQIDWGTSVVNEKIITSNGSGVSLDEFSIELGGFASGFVPTEANVDDWVSNWRVFDAVTAGDTDSSDNFSSVGIGSTESRFVGTDYLQADQTSASEDSNGLDTFGPSESAYIFIRNSDAPGVNSEWSLYTRSSDAAWEFPSVSGGQPATPLSWFVAQADTAVWGGINGSIVGGGEFTDGSSDFIIRTHTFVPEPGVAILSLLGLAGLLRRRRARS